MNKQAKYKLFVKMPEDPPKHLKKIDWLCIGCDLQYYIYLIEDGDIHFGCPNCGLFQIISGPWIIWN